MLVPEQFGFRKGLSTDNAAFKLTAINQKKTQSNILWSNESLVVSHADPASSQEGAVAS
jgi:hypothetical protein